MLDSIQVKKRLAQRGFSDDQAEGLAEEIVTLTESQLATKDDLNALRQDVDEKFAWWAFRIVLANGAVTAALLALYGFAG
jgi:hypothetical protein